MHLLVCHFFSMMFVLYLCCYSVHWNFSWDVPTMSIEFWFIGFQYVYVILAIDHVDFSLLNFEEGKLFSKLFCSFPPINQKYAFSKGKVSCQVSTSKI